MGSNRNNLCLRRLRRQVLGRLLHRLTQIVIGRNIVSIEHSSRPVARSPNVPHLNHFQRGLHRTCAGFVLVKGLCLARYKRTIRALVRDTNYTSTGNMEAERAAAFTER